MDATEVEVVPGHRRQLLVSGARREEEGRGGEDWRARVVVRGVVDVEVDADATDDTALVAAPTPPPVPPPALARIAAREKPPSWSGALLLLLARGGRRRTNSALSQRAMSRKNSGKSGEILVFFLFPLQKTSTSTCTLFLSLSRFFGLKIDVFVFFTIYYYLSLKRE